MRHFILASHGTFSRGIYNSVQIILGEQPNTHIITAYVEEGQDVNDLIEESLKDIPDTDPVIVCTDVFGGSVNNEWMKRLSRPNTHLITGMNLELLMNVFMRQDDDIENMIRQSVQEAKDGLIYCNDLLSNDNEEEF